MGGPIRSSAHPQDELPSSSSCPAAQHATINADSRRCATAAAAGENPPAAADRSSNQDKDSQWLADLSEPELDFLMSLKELARTRATNAGHPHLSDNFDLRTLQAIGVVLMGSFSEGLKKTSIDAEFLDRLALLSHSNVKFDNSGSSELVIPNEDNPVPTGVEKKRKQMKDGCHEEGARSQKKRKMS